MPHPVKKLNSDIAALQKWQYFYAALASGALILVLLRHAVSVAGLASFPSAWFGLAMIAAFLIGMLQVCSLRDEILRHRIWLRKMSA